MRGPLILWDVVEDVTELREELEELCIFRSPSGVPFQLIPKRARLAWHVMQSSQS